MRLLFSFALLLALSVPAIAASKKTVAAKPQEVVLYTGQKTGTYYAFGRDLAERFKGKTLVVRESEGSADNIKRLPAGKQFALGIVQSDVLGFLKRSQNRQSKDIVSHLRVIASLYPEEVHVLARKDIKDFRELQGKKVAIGEEGSGHMLTAVNLFAIEQVVPADIQKIPPEEGVVSVLKGELDAVVFVGGKPVKIFKNMEDLSKPENQKFTLLLQNVHFLPLSSARFYEEYEPTEITPRDYSFVKSTVPTVAVQSVLVSYDPSSKPKPSVEKARCERVRGFSERLSAALPSLKESGHPKWREVNLASSVPGWKKDACLGRAGSGN